jgi:hypothetical protein
MKGTKNPLIHMEEPVISKLGGGVQSVRTNGNLQKETEPVKEVVAQNAERKKSEVIQIYTGQVMVRSVDHDGLKLNEKLIMAEMFHSK